MILPSVVANTTTVTAAFESVDRCADRTNRRMEIKDNAGRYERELVNGDHRRLTPFATGHLLIFLLEGIFYLRPDTCDTHERRTLSGTRKKFLLIFIAPQKRMKLRSATEGDVKL